MKKHRILFLGTPEIAVPTLISINKEKNIEIAGVGVFPDKPVGRKQILTPCPVKITAQKLNIPIFEVQKKADIELLCEKLNPDLGIVIAFGMILTEKALSCPKYGMINVHFSLLPKYRGASPVQSAILNSEKTSGITFQKMAYALDSGDILFQKKYTIQGKKTSELFHFFAEETAQNMPKFLNNFFEQKIIPQKQNESKATFCTKFEREDGQIFPKKETAKEIYAKYLAFDLFPGIFLRSEKYGDIKLKEVAVQKPKGNFATLICKNKTTLYITKAQLPGGKEMNIQEIMRGRPDILKEF